MRELRDHRKEDYIYIHEELECLRSLSQGLFLFSRAGCWVRPKDLDCKKWLCRAMPSNSSELSEVAIPNPWHYMHRAAGSLAVSLGITIYQCKRTSIITIITQVICDAMLCHRAFAVVFVVQFNNTACRLPPMGNVNFSLVFVTEFWQQFWHDFLFLFLLKQCQCGRSKHDQLLHVLC